MYQELFDICWGKISQLPEFSGKTKPSFMLGKYDDRRLAYYSRKKNLVVVNILSDNGMPTRDERFMANAIYHELCHMLYVTHDENFTDLWARFYEGDKDEFANNIATLRNIDEIRANHLTNPEMVRAWYAAHRFDRQKVKTEVETIWRKYHANI